MADGVEASSELSKIAKLNGDFGETTGSSICVLSAPQRAVPGFGAAWYTDLYRPEIIERTLALMFSKVLLDQFPSGLEHLLRRRDGLGSFKH